MKSRLGSRWFRTCPRYIGPSNISAGRAGSIWARAITRLYLAAFFFDESIHAVCPSNINSNAPHTVFVDVARYLREGPHIYHVIWFVLLPGYGISSASVTISIAIYAGVFKYWPWFIYSPADPQFLQEPLVRFGPASSARSGTFLLLFRQHSR